MDANILDTLYNTFYLVIMSGMITLIDVTTDCMYQCHNDTIGMLFYVEIATTIAPLPVEKNVYQ